MKRYKKVNWYHAYDELLYVCLDFKAGECDLISRLIKYKFATYTQEDA
jgi:hypothetical protein